jgi:hypothetical protein
MGERQVPRFARAALRQADGFEELIGRHVRCVPRSGRRHPWPRRSMSKACP